MTAPFPAVPNLPLHVEAELHDHHLRHHPRGYVRSEADSRGRCGWRWAYEDVVLCCWAHDVPGYDYCPHHLRQAVYASPYGRRSKTRPIAAPRYAFTPEQIAAFWAKVDKEGPGGCWIWTGAVNGHRGGYGIYAANRRTYRTHVLAYRLTVGLIPDGLVLDHLCRVTACCNPMHLEPVTPLENARRGIGGQVARERAKAQTHCKHGHEYTPENTIISRAGTPAQQRLCRICRRASDRRAKDRKIAERAAARQAREAS